MADVTHGKAGGRTPSMNASDGWRRLKWLLPIPIALIVVIWLMFQYRDILKIEPSNVVTISFAVALAFILSGLPAVLCFVSNVSRRRQLSKLESLRLLPVGKTMFFQTAQSSIDSIRLVVNSDYALPIALFFLLTFAGFLTVLIAYSREQYFAIPSVLLGGLQDRHLATFTTYQLQTFCVIAMAFIGSYIYSLSRIIERINNNDLYPISLYYYTVRIIVACAAAAVLRHTIGVLGGGAIDRRLDDVSAVGAPLLLLIAFAVGFAPDLFIVAISRKAFQTLKIWGARTDPDEKSRPTSLPLLMIDDLSRDKIDRLNELGIDSAQVLARQNPFLLLPRLPFDLGLLVDWIGQAQLYTLVKDASLQKLREKYVRDIVDLLVRLECKEAQAEICRILGLSDCVGAALLRQLEEDPSFLRLREVKDALKPIAQTGPEPVKAAAGSTLEKIPNGHASVAKGGAMLPSEAA